MQVKTRATNWNDVTISSTEGEKKSFRAGWMDEYKNVCVSEREKAVTSNIIHGLVFSAGIVGSCEGAVWFTRDNVCTLYKTHSDRCRHRRKQLKPNICEGIYNVHII